MRIFPGVPNEANISQIHGNAQVAGVKGSVFPKPESHDLLSILSAIVAQEPLSGAAEQIANQVAGKDKAPLEKQEDLKGLNADASGTVELISAPPVAPTLSAMDRKHLSSREVTGKDTESGKAGEKNIVKKPNASADDINNIGLTAAPVVMQTPIPPAVSRKEWSRDRSQISTIPVPQVMTHQEATVPGATAVEKEGKPDTEMSDVRSVPEGEKEIVPIDAKQPGTVINEDIVPQIVTAPAEQPPHIERVSLPDAREPNALRTSQIIAPLQSLQQRIQAQKSKDSPKSTTEPISIASTRMENIGLAGHAQAFSLPQRMLGNRDVAVSKSEGVPPSPTGLFQRMDSGDSQTTLLRANPHEIAVGVRDPSLGWVEIHTQFSSGHLNASLTATSPETHAKLVAETPALAQYMAERDVPVHTVNVAMQGGEAGGGQSRSGSENAQQYASGPEQKVLHDGHVQALSSDEEIVNLDVEGAPRISVRA